MSLVLTLATPLSALHSPLSVHISPTHRVPIMSHVALTALAHHLNPRLPMAYPPHAPNTFHPPPSTPHKSTLHTPRTTLHTSHATRQTSHATLYSTPSPLASRPLPPTLTCYLATFLLCYFSRPQPASLRKKQGTTIWPGLSGGIRGFGVAPL